MIAHQQKYWSFNGWDGPKYSLGQQAKDNTYHAFNQYKKIVIATLKFPDFNQFSMIFNKNKYYKKLYITI